VTKILGGSKQDHRFGLFKLIAVLIVMRLITHNMLKVKRMRDHNKYRS